MFIRAYLVSRQQNADGAVNTNVFNRINSGLVGLGGVNHSLVPGTG